MSFGWPGSGLCLLPLANGLLAATFVIARSFSPGPVPQPSVPVLGPEGFTRSPGPLGTEPGFTTSAPPSGVSISRCPCVWSPGRLDPLALLGKMLLPASFSIDKYGRADPELDGQESKAAAGIYSQVAGQPQVGTDDFEARRASASRMTVNYLFFRSSRFRFAQPSLFTCRPRATANASSGTFSVTHDAAPM